MGEDDGGCGREHSHPLDSRGALVQTEGGGAGGCGDLETGTGTYVEMKTLPSRSGADNVEGHSDGPIPGLEVEGTGGSGGCSAGTDPYVMVEQQGWG